MHPMLVPPVGNTARNRRSRQQWDANTHPSSQSAGCKKLRSVGPGVLGVLRKWERDVNTNSSVVFRQIHSGDAKGGSLEVQNMIFFKMQG